MHELLLVRGNPFLMAHISPPYLLTSREQRENKTLGKKVRMSPDSETKTMAKNSASPLQTK